MPPRRTSIKASELGCALNCVVTTGRTVNGLPPANDTALLNTYLARASASNPIELILDGCAYVNGLILSPEGHTTIRGLGWDTGIFLASGSNADGIRLGPYSNIYGGNPEGGGNPAPHRTASNIILRDFTLNGNGAPHGNTSSDRQGVAPANTPIQGAPPHPAHGAIFLNCTNVLIDHVNFVNAPYFNLTFSNGNGLIVRDSNFTSRNTYQDGVHIDGPSEDIVITGCTFATGDDSIALNAPEGFGGDITGVLVDNCRFHNAHTVARVYSSTKDGVRYIRNLVFASCTGSTRQVCFNLGVENGGTPTVPDQITDILIADCDLSSPAGLTVSTNPVGSLTIKDTTFRAPTTVTPVVRVMSGGIRDLVLDGITILRTPEGNAAAPLLEGGVLGRLTVSGIRVVDESTTGWPPIPAVFRFNDAVAGLRLNSIDMQHFGTLLDSSHAWAHVTPGSLSGAGVLGTGVPVPDTVMADNTLYLSATTSQLTLKMAGATKTF